MHWAQGPSYWNMNVVIIFLIICSLRRRQGLDMSIKFLIICSFRHLQELLACYQQQGQLKVNANGDARQSSWRPLRRLKRQSPPMGAYIYPWYWEIFVCGHAHLDGLVQERRESSAFALELRLPCINPSIWYPSLGSKTLKYQKWRAGPKSLALKCLFNSLYKVTSSKKATELHITGLLWGKPPLTVGFPWQRTSSVESIPYHDVIMCQILAFVLTHIR